MTAQVVDLFPTGEQADDTVRRTIDAVAKGRGLTREQVADGIGMARSTFYRKISGKGSANPFTAGEVATVAKFLRLRVGQLYDGLGGTFVPPEPPPNGGSSLPRLDSNQEPFEYWYPQVRALPMAA